MRERGILGKAALGTAIAAYRIVEGMVVPKISSICANSRFTRQNIAKYLKRDDATVAHPAVETADFDCKGYEKFFFYPSRIVPEKRLEYAIEAFKKSKLGGKGWKLRIGGHLVPSKRNLAYMEMLKSAAKGGGVEFELNMDEKRLRGAYADCYSTVFCGKREDWGIVPLESMASKKPCISVNEGGPRESILDGKTGFLVNSAEQMAEKMEFLAGHRDECEKMGRAGRKRAEQNYTWKIFLSKMDKAFRETAKGKDGS
jgi:glycosyltransferase involved in cell wall biosynthesis